ncbi:hypothetical protein HON22_01420 [Candidatus Peregrinibacteria bacterium]|jgi:hypothetical protein|nr:hypothetical protein [Candidatus Peregrinibacteria bacterium]
MKLSHLFLSLALLVSLSACQLPSNETDTETTLPETTMENTAVDSQNTETSTSSNTAPELGISSDLYPGLEDIDIKDVVGGIESFQLSTDPNFARCVKQSVTSCESQAVSLKIQESGDSNDCNILSDSYAQTTCKDNAISTKALQDKNVAACDSISEDYRKQQCKTDVLRMQARENLDESYCNKIADLYQKEEAASDAGITSPYASMGESYVKQCTYDIYSQKAQSEGDEKLCEKIEDESMKQMCVSMVSYSKQSAAFESTVDAGTTDASTRSVPKN